MNLKNHKTDVLNINEHFKDLWIISWIKAISLFILSNVCTIVGIFHHVAEKFISHSVVVLIICISRLEVLIYMYKKIIYILISFQFHKTSEANVKKKMFRGIINKMLMSTTLLFFIICLLGNLCFAYYDRRKKFARLLS